MNSTLIVPLASLILGGGGLARFFKYRIDKLRMEIAGQQSEASLADVVGSSAKGWIAQQDQRVNDLQRDLEAARKETAQVRLDGAREVQQLREELGKLSQELNAFRLGIAAPLGYVIIPRLIWEQARARDAERGELPRISFPGEDVHVIVRDIKDPPEGGGV